MNFLTFLDYKAARFTMCAVIVLASIFAGITAIAMDTEVKLTSKEIKAQLEEAKMMRDKAHELAESIRDFGEEDSNPGIQFAKEKWYELTEHINNLEITYKETVQKETEAAEKARLQKEAEEKAKQEREQKGTYIGTFRISHYCPGSCCNGGYSGTALGGAMSPWYTVAVDPSVIRLGSAVYIEGYGQFKAQDTGGAIKGNRIDVCVGSHSEAMRLGIVYRDVYVK